jgi:uncharacterized membrane protein YgcG
LIKWGLPERCQVFVFEILFFVFCFLLFCQTQSYIPRTFLNPRLCLSFFGLFYFLTYMVFFFSQRRCVILADTAQQTRVAGAVRRGEYDVISSDWVRLCTRRGRLVWPPPEHMVFGRSPQSLREAEATALATRELDNALRAQRVISGIARQGKLIDAAATSSSHAQSGSSYARAGSSSSSSMSSGSSGSSFELAKGSAAALGGSPGGSAGGTPSESPLSHGAVEDFLHAHPGLRPAEFLFFECVVYFDAWVDPLCTEASAPLRRPMVDAARCLAIRYGARVAANIRYSARGDTRVYIYRMHTQNFCTRHLTHSSYSKCKNR